MSQRLFHVGKVGRHSQIMVGRTEREDVGRFPPGVEIEILQAGGETVDVSADIEKIHGAVEFVVGAIDGVEPLENLMPHKADAARRRDSKVFVTAQIVETQSEIESGNRFIGSFGAGHPRLDENASSS